VKVHHLVHAAVPLARRTPRLLESTFNRTDMWRMVDEARAAGVDIEGDFAEWNPDDPMDDGNPLGEPESAITWQVDVSSYLDQRRASMEAHRSQATDIEQFLSMPDDVFALAFGTEHYIEPGVDGPMRRGWPFAD
jgi:LmbE family N-acetylglucosaminyl deacetylase